LVACAHQAPEREGGGAPLASAESRASTRPLEFAIDVAALRKHVEFLAADAQQGRAPGTEADARVQQYIQASLAEAGLAPAFGGSFRQPFTITDGVRSRQGQSIALVAKSQPIPHSILPFSGASPEPVAAKAIFVGYGIAPSGVGTGDYEGLQDQVKGKIVIARDGAPDDPHLTPAETRAQSKLIAAREHGAVGFILWDRYSEVDYPNHGEANDLRIPAVFVGKEGGVQLARLLGARKPDLDIQRGAATRSELTMSTPIEPIRLETGNVGARLAGRAGAVHTIVIGAHMDHLGLGTVYSLAPGEREIHNGADDNASGVAAMLEVCKALANTPASERAFDVTCLAFGAEESGLLGSKHFVKNLAPADKEAIVAMLNFDMVGRLTRRTLTMGGVGTSSKWGALVDRYKRDLSIQPMNDGYGPSDHGSFYEAGIPVLHFFTGSHADYHKPSDDIDKINFQGMVDVCVFAAQIAVDLVVGGEVPDYVRTKPPAQRGGGFRVSLGTIPDYGAQVDGVRLAGVREGGPAAAAGLVAGDIIVQLGKMEVHNLDDYMAAFARMNPGEKVPVTVVRDGKRLELELVPAAPKRR
jgi:hypothetical protein